MISQGLNQKFSREEGGREGGGGGGGGYVSKSNAAQPHHFIKNVMATALAHKHSRLLSTWSVPCVDGLTVSDLLCGWAYSLGPCCVDGLTVSDLLCGWAYSLGPAVWMGLQSRTCCVDGLTVSDPADDNPWPPLHKEG